MAEALECPTFARWRADPISFIEHVLYDPETKRPFVLLDAERAFLQHAFTLDANGRLLYPELLYGAPKKSGKTGFAALYVLTMILLFGGPFGEAYCVANDLEQATSRVYQAIRRIVEASPLLRHEAKITEGRITFPAFNATMWRWRRTTVLPLAPIRRSAASTNCGATPASAHVVYGMRW